MLEAAGVEYVDELYPAVPDPALCQGWQTIKKSLPLDFPNVPYMYDGDIKISQSIAILRYLARKFGFNGDSQEEITRIELIEQQLADWRTQGCIVFYSDNFEKLVDDYRNGLHDKMTALSKFLGKDNFLAGSKVKYIDFLMYEYLEVQEIILPGILDKTPSLKEFRDRIQSIGNIKKYLSSDRCKQLPIYNKLSKMGQRLDAGKKF